MNETKEWQFRTLDAKRHQVKVQQGDAYVQIFQTEDLETIAIDRPACGVYLIQCWEGAFQLSVGKNIIPKGVMILTDSVVQKVGTITRAPACIVIAQLSLCAPAFVAGMQWHIDAIPTAVPNSIISCYRDFLGGNLAYRYIEIRAGMSAGNIIGAMDDYTVYVLEGTGWYIPKEGRQDAQSLKAGVCGEIQGGIKRWLNGHFAAGENGLKLLVIGQFKP